MAPKISVNFSMNLYFLLDGFYGARSAVITQNDEQRKTLLKQAEKLLVDEMPVIPIFVDTFKYMTHDNIEGFVIEQSGIMDLKKTRLRVSKT